MLELALRSAAILAVAWLGTRMLARASAATSHLVWHAAVVAVLLAPLLAPVAPTFQLTFLNPFSQPLQSAFGDIASGARLDEWPARPQNLADAGAPKAAGDTRAHEVRSLVAKTWGDIAAVAIWPTGSLVLGLWFVTGWALAAASVRRTSEAPVAWHAELDDLRRRLQIRQPVGVRVFAHHASPMAVGFLGSTILLPSSAAAWSADRRYAVLLHELAHIKRGDCRAHALAQMACALYWFNPLVWKALAELRRERERACDDEVLRSGTPASTYAAHLLEIARGLKPSFVPRAALAMARPSELEGRLLAVLADRRARVPVRASRWCVATLMAAATGLALGATPARPAPADGPHPLTPAVRHNMFGETPTFEQQVEAYRARTTASEALAASPDPEARERAVLDLAASATDTTIPSLTRALRDESQDVREKAAFALGLLSSPDVIPPLLQALRDPDAQVREKAAIGLALRRDPRSVEALIAAMRDPDSQVREKVALSLGTSGDDRAVPSLSAALSDQDPQVREKATLALGFLNTGTPDASHSEDVRSALRSLVSGLLGLAR